MQVSATLIAAQQSAREAQARFHAAHVAPQGAQTSKAPPAPQASFSAALGKPQSFSPLPLKQTVAAPQAAAARPEGRLGTMLDIKV